jgi:hypothetical protein
MGQVTTTVAGSDGAYVLTNLPVGPYRFEAAAAAFSTYVQSGITLQVGNNVQVNAVLQVGKVTDTITISAAAAMVETQDTSISQVIDQRRIADLPLNGRQVTDLILLSGGSNIQPKRCQPRRHLSVVKSSSRRISSLNDLGDCALRARNNDASKKAYAEKGDCSELLPRPPTD